MTSEKKDENSKKPKEYIFVKNKKRSITSQVNSAKRYADESGQINYQSETKISG